MEPAHVYFLGVIGNPWISKKGNEVKFRTIMDKLNFENFNPVLCSSKN